MTEETLFDRGLKVRKEVLGEDYVNKSIARASTDAAAASPTCP